MSDMINGDYGRIRKDIYDTSVDSSFHTREEDELASIFANENIHEDTNFSSFQWEDIEAIEEKNFFGIKNGNFVYTTSDGTKITLKSTDNVQIKQNKETGEIVIIGAENAVISGSNEDVKLSILNSTIDDISMGDGKDNIYIKNSTINSIETSKGDDTITIANSNVGYVTSGRGHDDINILNSEIETVYTDNGNDAVIISNSKIKDELNTGNNDDYIYSINSDLNNIFSSNGNDEVHLEKTSANKLESGKGEDRIILEDSNDIASINSGKGVDTIKSINSNLLGLDADKNDIIQTPETETAKIIQSTYSSSISELDETSQDQAQEITKNITSNYADRELSPEEEIQALTINFFSKNLENMKSQFEAQELEDGKINDGYNWIKQLTDLGVSKDDIQAAIAEQEQMVNELQAALNGESDKSFEEVFHKWTGIEYSQENMTKYLETSQYYSLAMTGITKAQNFENIVNNPNASMEDVFNGFIDYYGDEETARIKFNEQFEEYYKQHEGNIGIYQKVYINENNEFVREIPDFYGNTTVITKNLNEVSNRQYSNDGIWNVTAVDDFSSTFEETMGVSIKDLQNDLATIQVETFGKGNSFQKLINKYCQEQEGFADALATGAQFTGMGLMVVGSVVMMACPAAAGVGGGIMQAGKYLSLGGMLGDNALELIDNISSENGLTKDEAWALAKETMVDLALYYSGRQINGVSANTKATAAELTQTLSKTQQQVLCFMAEIGTDASLSLLADYMITGEVDLSGEGISQLLGIITGIAGAKVDAHNKAAFDDANKYLSDSDDLAGSLIKLGTAGLSTKAITQYGKAYGLELSSADIKNIRNGSFEIPKTGFYPTKNIPNYNIDVEIDDNLEQFLSQNEVLSDLFVNGKLNINELKTIYGSDVETSAKVNELLQDPEIIDLINSGKLSVGELPELTKLDSSKLKTRKLNLKNIDAYTEQLAKLNDTAYSRAMDLMDKGFPIAKVADASVLTGEKAQRVDALFDEGINPYYIAQLADLDTKAYEQALDLIRNEKFTAPSALDVVTSSNYEKAFNKYKSGEEAMKIELTDEIHDTLLAQAEAMFNKYSGFIGDARTNVALITGETTMALTGRPKGISSVLNKLITKFEKGKLNLSPEVIEAQCKKAIGDFFGTRIQMMSLHTTSSSDITAPENAEIVKKFISDTKLTYEETMKHIENGTKPDNVPDFDARIAKMYETIETQPAKAIQTTETITKALIGTGLTYDEFMTHMKNGTQPANMTNFEAIKIQVIDALKVQQTQATVDELVKQITDHKIVLTELNNYGTEITSYFTNEQLYQIAAAHKKATGEKLTIVTKMDLENVTAARISADGETETEYRIIDKEKGTIEGENYIIKPKGSVKDSGYTSTQMNVTHELPNKQTGNGELQIRGSEVNIFGDVEHVPYDIRQGKITAKDVEYADVYATIKNMSDESYENYNKYLSATYEYLRLKELGIETPKPKLEGEFLDKNGNPIPDSEMQKLTKDGLTQLKAEIDARKKQNN